MFSCLWLITFPFQEHAVIFGLNGFYFSEAERFQDLVPTAPLQTPAKAFIDETIQGWVGFFVYYTKFIHNTLCRCFDENPETSWDTIFLWNVRI